MKDSTTLINKNDWKKRWTRIVIILASVVVFFTTYALILPAITWQSTLICQQEEHIHKDSCYQLGENGERVVICGIEEHTHTAACFDAPPAEVNRNKCDLAEHTHDDSCYFEDGTLRCTIPEHTHIESCFYQQDEKTEELLSNSSMENGAAALLAQSPALLAAAPIQSLEKPVMNLLGAENDVIPEGYELLDGTWMKLTSSAQIEENATYLIANGDCSQVLVVDTSGRTVVPAAISIEEQRVENTNNYYRIYAQSTVLGNWTIKKRPNRTDGWAIYSHIGNSDYPIELKSNGFFGNNTNTTVILAYTDGHFTIKHKKNNNYLNFSGTQFMSGTPGDVTIYRLMEDYEDTIFLTFVFTDIDEDNQAVSIPRGSSLEIEEKSVPTFTRDGANLMGFRIDGGDGNILSADSIRTMKFSQDTTFIADWQIANMIEVYYNFGSQTINVYPIAPTEIRQNTSLSNLPAPRWYDWAEPLEFSGWYLDNNFQTKYTNQTLRADTTLYAKFQADLTYDSNDGSSKQHEQTFVVGNTITLWDNSGTDSFVRERYRLIGWNTKADGSGTAYALDGSIKPEGNLTLYAQWDQLGYMLSVKKIVDGASDPSGIRFSFEAEIQPDEERPNQAFGEPAQTGTYTVSEDGKTAFFTIGHEEQVDLMVPQEAIVKITELNNGGYNVKFVIDEVEINSNTYNVLMSEDTLVVVHNAVGQALPSTGGRGRAIFYIVGILLIAGSLGYGMISYITRQKK